MPGFHLEPVPPSEDEPSVVDPAGPEHDHGARDKGQSTPHQRPKEPAPANLLTERRDATQQALRHSHPATPPLDRYGTWPHRIQGSLRLVRKEYPNSPRKIDSVVGDALAYEARGGDHGDQDQHCGQEGSEQPPRRHAEPDQTGTEDTRQDCTDRRRQHVAERHLVELGLAAIELRLCDEENPDVEAISPAKNNKSLRLSSAGSIRLLIIGPAVPFAVLTIAAPDSRSTSYQR
jgi:hypothetical protein